MNTSPEANLAAAAKLFKAKNAEYGEAYKRAGNIMTELYPDGLTINAADEWARVSVVLHCLNCLLRYTAKDGGHADSARDLTVYAAMLTEVTK